MIFRRITLFLFLFIGIMMLTQSIRNILRIKETENWRKIEAEVESINIEKIEKPRGDRFYPKINFRYNVNGKTYKGNRLTFESGMVYHSESDAASVAYGYLKKGDKSKIEIYYDPINPKAATIFRGNKEKEYPLIYYGIVFLVIGLLVNGKMIIKIIKTVFNKT